MNTWAIIADNKVLVRGTATQMASIYQEFLHDMETAEGADWIPNKIELMEITETATPKRKEVTMAELITFTAIKEQDHAEARINLNGVEVACVRIEIINGYVNIWHYPPCKNYNDAEPHLKDSFHVEDLRESLDKDEEVSDG